MRHFNIYGVRTLIAVGLLAGAGLCAAAQPAFAPTDIKAQAKALVQLLAEGEYAMAENGFTAKMQQALPAAKLKATWQQIQAQAGNYEKMTEVKQTEAKGYRVVLVKTLFKNKALWTQVAFDPSGKIAGLYFKPVPAT
ncbi:MAG TPA: DUF3887 domain-containing protein [Gammaproteobacteria bacterium]|nr:DUF3887 domain-containing protein [Gammaproteobacteria bacterium]